MDDLPVLVRERVEVAVAEGADELAIADTWRVTAAGLGARVVSVSPQPIPRSWGGKLVLIVACPPGVTAASVQAARYLGV